MALFDLLKKKKKAEGLKKQKPELKPKIEARETLAIEPKKSGRLAYGVLHSPHISEKATTLQNQRKYVFEVFPNTNKVEIKKAIEGLYGVKVQDVNVVNIPRKPKRFGRIRGFQKGYKKAIVTLGEGQKIEIMPH